MKKLVLKPVTTDNRSGCGGYDVQFVQSPPDLVKCVICCLPSKNPYLSECCGHIFCKTCLYQYINNTPTACVCPVCKARNFNTFSNKQIDREVKSLHVYCTNKEKGCTWKGELNYMGNHLKESDGCQYEEVSCSLDCNTVIQRRYLTDHLKNKCPCRRVTCQYCLSTGEHQFIEGKHKDKCPKLTLPCPNKCEVGSVPCEDMEAHRKECPLEVVQCEYHNVGCEARMIRKKRRSHEEENIEEHLRMTKLKLAKTEDKLLSTEDKLLFTGDKLLFTEERVNNLEVMLNSLIYNSTGSGMVMVASNWASHLAILATDSPNTPLCPVTPVIIKLPRFKSHAESGDRWYSDSFFTYEKGYKMCLSTIANRDIGNLSVWLHVMKGPHDEYLTWPLRGKFEIKLMNQISDTKHCSSQIVYDEKVDNNSCSRVTDDKIMAKGWGFSRFISLDNLHETIKGCQFVKENCIFFQIRSYK